MNKTFEFFRELKIVDPALYAKCMTYLRSISIRDEIKKHKIKRDILAKGIHDKIKKMKAQQQALDRKRLQRESDIKAAAEEMKSIGDLETELSECSSERQKVKVFQSQHALIKLQLKSSECKHSERVKKNIRSSLTLSVQYNI